MEEKEYVIRKGMTSYEEAMVKRFPYNILIRCWSLMRRAEENFYKFHEEYYKYASNPVNCTVDHVFFEEIPITEDGKYFLNLTIEDCMVRYFSIISK